MSGVTTPGLPLATLPLVGTEQASFDTLALNGINPETEAINVSTLATYFTANGGTATGRIGTATASTGAATLSSAEGYITTEALTTAAAADYTLTLTNTLALVTSNVFVTVENGTNTTEGIAVNRVQSANGSVVIHIRNTNASSALNGTLGIGFMVRN